MDPLSITVSCVSLTAAIGKTTSTVTKFVRDVRGARSDLDAVSRELLSLNTVLELLAEDVCDPNNGTFPTALQKQITGIITNCNGVVVEIQCVLDKHEGTKLTKAAKWVAFGNDDMNKLRSSLEAHKSALEIALEMIALTLTREIKVDTTEILQDTSAIKDQMTADTDKIIAEIVRLQEQLPKNPGPANPNTFMLERYLDNLTSYCESTVYDDNDESLDRINATASKRGSLAQDHTFSETIPVHLSEMGSENQNPLFSKPRRDITYESNHLGGGKGDLILNDHPKSEVIMDNGIYDKDTIYSPGTYGFKAGLEEIPVRVHTRHTVAPNLTSQQTESSPFSASISQISSSNLVDEHRTKADKQKSVERRPNTLNSNPIHQQSPAEEAWEIRRPLGPNLEQKKQRSSSRNRSVGQMGAKPESSRSTSKAYSSGTSTQHKPRASNPSTQAKSRRTNSTRHQGGRVPKFYDDYEDDSEIPIDDVPNKYSKNSVMAYPITPHVGHEITSHMSNLKQNMAWNQVTYSAITCWPADFRQNGFRLRQTLLATRQPDVLFYVLVTSKKEWGVPLMQTMESIFQSVAELSTPWLHDSPWNCCSIVIISSENTGSDLHDMGVTLPMDDHVLVGGQFVLGGLFETTLSLNKGSHGIDIVFFQPVKDNAVASNPSKSFPTKDWLLAFTDDVDPRLCVQVEVGTRVQPSTMTDIWNTATKTSSTKQGHTQFLIYKEKNMVVRAARGLFGR